MRTMVASGFVFALTLVACSGQVRVEAKGPPLEPVVEPAPPPPSPPPPEEPKAGDRLTLPEQIEFETNEARIRQVPKTLETLNQLAETMKQHPKITKLRIEGHTDNVGTSQRNDRLSKARAEAVAKWLEAHEIERSRLVTVGFGARRPLAPNDSAEHRSMNRRTEYYVEEIDGKKVEQESATTTTSAPVTSKN